MYRARQGKNLTALLRGEACRYQGAAAASGLDHQRAEGQAADQPVAFREVALVGMRAERVFAYQRAVGCDAVSKIVVFSRVYAVNTVTEKSDRGTIGIERPAVR